MKNNMSEQCDVLLGGPPAIGSWTSMSEGPCNLISRDYPTDYESIVGNTPAGDSERSANRKSFLSELDFDALDTVVPKLVHGGLATYVNAHNKYIEDLQCDALVTDVRDLALTMTFADCPTVMLYDSEARVLGLAHAGWKSIASDIVEHTLILMQRIGAHRSRIDAFVGPGVRKCCYEVGPEVATAVDGRLHNGHVQIDLSDIIVARLVAKGVSVNRITQHQTCTCCGIAEYSGKPIYYSFRRDKRSDPLDAQMFVAWMS